MENPGNGRESPFGDSAGSTKSGPSSGGNNFLTNPMGNGPKGGGRNFVTEKAPEQPKGPGGINQDSIPAGGKLPFNSSTSRAVYYKPGEAGHKPFKLQGDNPGSTAVPDSATVDVAENYLPEME